MDFKQIQTIIKEFEKSNMTSLEIEAEDFRIKLSKQLDNQELMTEVITPEKQSTVDASLCEVKAPLVGTFYRLKQGKELVKVGDKIMEGQVLCIIEAMKIMNEITAPQSGVIEEIRLNNGEPVGFDQVMITIRAE